MPETLGFVAPGTGRTSPGGAEAECRATARALRDRGVPVEILTTCARDHASRLDRPPPGRRDRGGRLRRPPLQGPAARTPSGTGALQWRMSLGGTLNSFEEEDFVRRLGQLQRPLRLSRRRARSVLVRVHPVLLRHHLGGRAGRARALAPDPVPPRRAVRPAEVDAPRAPRGARRRASTCPPSARWRRAWPAPTAERFHLVGEGVDPPPPGDGAAVSAEVPGATTPSCSTRAGRRRRRTRRSSVEYFARYRLTHPGAPAQARADRLGWACASRRACPRTSSTSGSSRPRTRRTRTPPPSRSASRRSSRASRIVMMEAWLAGTPVARPRAVRGDA